MFGLQIDSEGATGSAFGMADFVTRFRAPPSQLTYSAHTGVLEILL